MRAPFSGQLTFETSTPDAQPSDPSFGEYRNAGRAFDGFVGLIPFVKASSVRSDVLITDKPAGGGTDIMSILGTARIQNEPLWFSLTMLDTGGGVFDSDLLPLVPPALADLDDTAFTLSSEVLGISVFGELTRLVPEPSSLCVMGLGVSVVLVRRRRRDPDLGRVTGMRRDRRSGAAGLATVLLAVGMGSPLARADLVTWEFEGVLTSVNDYTGFLGPSVYVGAPFSGQLTFDTSVPDSNPGNPHAGTYPQALLSISGDVGAVPFAGGSGPVSYISVLDDQAITLHDFIGVDGLVMIDGEVIEAYLSLRDFDGVMLTSDALPLDPPDVGLMETRVFGLASEALGLSVRGTLSSLTPEPGTLAVLGLGVAQLAIGRRTRPRQWARARHSSRRTLALLAWMAVFCLFPACQPARAVLVTWEFEGVLTSVNDYTGFLGPSVYVGAPFSGQLTFDTSVPDNDPGDPHTGSYPQALVTISGNVGEVSFGGGSGPTSRILVVNDDPTTLHDVMSIGGRVSINGQAVETYLNFRDWDAVMLTSDALPVLPLDVGLMETRVFGLASEALGLSVRGTLSSLTPEPGTFAVLAVGVVHLALWRRTRPTRTAQARHRLRRTPTVLAWMAVFCLFPAYQPARASCDPAAYNCTGVPACRCTDLVVLWDLTPSLDLAFDNIQAELPSVLEMAWCRAGGSPGDLRVGLIVFFNAEPLEGKDAVKVRYPLTSDVQDACVNGIGNPTSGILFGVGYGPEASDEALHEMLGATAWAGAASCVHTPAVRFTEPFRQECRKIAILITDAVPGTCNENASTCEARLRGYRWADQAAAAGIELADPPP